MSRRGSILQDYGGRFEPQPQDAQRDAAQYYQRDKELAAQQKQHQQTAKAKEQGDAVDYIGGLKADHVGDTTIDQYNDALIKGVQDELMGMMQKGAGVNEIKMAAIPKLQKIAAGHTIAKDEYGKIVETKKNLQKDYPEGNADAAGNVMGKEMLDNLFEYDENGKIKGYKDPSSINTNKSYSDALFDKEKMDAWYPETTDALVANVQKTRGLTPIKGQLKLINSRGGYTDKKYEGHLSIYDRPTVDDEGKITGIELDAENVPLGKNADGTANVIQVMPEDKYNVFRGDGKSAMQFDRAVYNHISKDLGINPKSLDPQALDIYSRNYALEMLRKTGLNGSSYNQFDIEKAAPVKTITNVHVNNGSGKAPVPVMDIVTPVRDYFENNKDYSAARFNMFNNEVTTPVMNEVKNRYPDITADEIYYKNTPEGIYVMKTDTPTVINDKKDVPVFKLDDFSNVTGNKPQGQKSKNEALRQAQSGKAKTFNVVNPNTGEVIMKGVDEAAANKAKAKGYKIQ